jgi:hypothetical protein
VEDKEKKEPHLLLVHKKRWYGDVFVCECYEIISVPPFIRLNDKDGLMIALILEKDFSYAITVK